ncbi:MAG: phosphate signaling complex protein PhoU [Hyphomicrobiaceae bacterium]
MDRHTVSGYDEDLMVLNRRIAQMGGLAEQLLAQAFEALAARDPQRANVVVERDVEIDELQRALESQVVQLIARRQPMADDLRQIMAAMRIASDLERIGDLAKNIAKRAAAIADQQYPRQLVSGIQHMVELAQLQLKNVLDAYLERDAELALTVWRDDERIDATYNSVFRELQTYMMEDPRNIGHCTHLLFGAKNIERIGDHTTNIAETVYFYVTGETLPDQRPKADTTSSTLVQAS